MHTEEVEPLFLNNKVAFEDINLKCSWKSDAFEAYVLSTNAAHKGVSYFQSLVHIPKLYYLDLGLLKLLMFVGNNKWPNYIYLIFVQHWCILMLVFWLYILLWAWS